MAAHQAPLSLGFSRQEHWSGLPFPSPVHGSEKWKWSHSVVSDSQRPHGLQPTRLLHPWDFPGKSTGVGCHCLLSWNSALRCLYLSFFPLLFTSLLFTAICKASPDIHFAFLHFFSMAMFLIPVSCTMSQTSVHSLSGTLSIRSRPLNLFLYNPLYNHKGFDLGHTWMV